MSKKTIKITEENAADIEAALAAINGRASAFATTSFARIAEIVGMAEKQIAILPRSSRVGVSISHIPAGPSAKAYGHSAVSTRVTLEWKSAGWHLVGVERTKVYPRSPERVRISLSLRQAEEIARRSVSSFVIRKPACEDASGHELLDIVSRHYEIFAGA